MNTTHSSNVLEAEGELNRQILAALQTFRKKLVNDANPYKPIINTSEPYESNKQGPEKVFVFRQSLLSLMFQINDFRTLYNMFAASFIIFTSSLLYNSYKAKGELVDVLQLSKFFLGGKTIIVAWPSLAVIFYLTILVTKIALKTKWYIWIPLYLTQISALMATATYFSMSEGLGFATIVIIMCETVRMIMKSYSYLRTKLLYVSQNEYSDYEFRGNNVINVANGQSKGSSSDKTMKISIRDEDLFSQIKKLSYFFFCPTLIYRDEYTLTPVRSFKSILVHTLNFLACTYYAFILYKSQCKPVIESLQNNLNTQTFISAIINLMLPSVLFLILGFFGFLHSWLNAWSEITRFPDRAFYSDWWNCCQFGTYYRKWNIVVHDWLYYYIYLDLHRFFPSLKKIRAIPQLLTFFISAIIHETIIFYALGFFYPILFILFTGPGVMFMQSTNIKKISVNLLFWLKMYLGTAIMISLYLIESFARHKINDQFINEKWGVLSFCISRTLYLNQI